MTRFLAQLCECESFLTSQREGQILTCNCESFASRKNMTFARWALFYCDLLADALQCGHQSKPYFILRIRIQGKRSMWNYMALLGLKTPF